MVIKELSKVAFQHLPASSSLPDVMSLFSERCLQRFQHGLKLACRCPGDPDE